MVYHIIIRISTEKCVFADPGQLFSCLTFILTKSNCLATVFSEPDLFQVPYLMSIFHHLVTSKEYIQIQTPV